MRPKVDPNYLEQQQQQQQQRVKYVTPANIQYTQKDQTGQKTQNVESPAQKYQFIGIPQGRPDDEAASQIQYYFPREKEVASHVQQSYNTQESQGAMKVVGFLGF